MKSLLYNGKIYLEREKFAEAVLISDGMIQKVGSTSELLILAGERVEKIDCQGKTVVPGFNDSHMHLVMFGESFTQAAIKDCTSIDELVEQCKKFISNHPEKVKQSFYASGWNQDYFENDKRVPTRHDLDKISTEIPIILDRVCGHILSTNTKAIELLGLDSTSPQWPGGTFEKEETGYPNGIFTENACNYVKKLSSEVTIDQREEMLMEAMKYAVAHGITSVQSNDVGTAVGDMNSYFKMFHKVFNEGRGLLRYHHQVCFNQVEEFREYVEKGEFARGQYPEGSWLTLGPLKLFKDGSLGARTALMSQEYHDAPGIKGEEWVTDSEMREYCKIADQAGIQIVTHVIGDKAITDTIKCYEEVFRDGKNELRHGLVHCQITTKAMLEEIAEKEILVFYQPIFLDYDMKIVENRCGKELASSSYAFGTMDKLGGYISYGTDCPVESCNPFPNIYSAVTRKDSQGNPASGFYPEESVDIYAAIDAYTAGSAYAEFMEHKKGRIKEGYYADLVILNKDIFTINPLEIKDIQVDLTMVGGKVVYKS